MRNKKLVFVFIVVLAIIAITIKRCNKYNREEVKENIATSVNSEKGSRGLNRDVSRLFYSKHAKCRMECGHISQKEVREILEQGTINYRKSDLQDARGPEYAVEGITSDRQKVRIVFAPRKTQTTVITVIDLDNDWSCPSCN